MSEGRSWIFIRGLTRGQGHWGEFLPAFRARFPGEPVECLDLAGNGERVGELSFTTAEAAARDLRARSALVREGRRPHVLAHSLGAMVAAEWQRLFPADFARLYLMNTSGRDTGRPLERFHPSAAGPFLRAGLARSEAAREKWILSVIVNDEARRAAAVPEMAAYSAAHPVRPVNFFRQLRAAAGFRFAAMAPGPVEILCARGDRLVSVENSLRLAARWGIEPRIHPSAGHDIPLDDPRWLVEQLL